MTEFYFYSSNFAWMNLGPLELRAIIRLCAVCLLQLVWLARAALKKRQAWLGPESVGRVAGRLESSVALTHRLLQLAGLALANCNVVGGLVGVSAKLVALLVSPSVAARRKQPNCRNYPPTHPPSTGLQRCRKKEDGVKGNAACRVVDLPFPWDRSPLYHTQSCSLVWQGSRG